MLGFLEALVTVGLPIIFAVSVSLGLLLSVVSLAIYGIVRHYRTLRINDIQGHHIRR